MERLVLEPIKSLNGVVRISGAKNAALPLLCAGLLTDDSLRLTNVPRLEDVTTTLSLLAELGVSINVDDHDGISLSSKEVHSTTAPYELVRSMRASILVLGPLVAKFKNARVSLPGGCAIGSRPVDLHIKGLIAMGADIEVDDGFVIAKADRLYGTEIVMDLVSVTGTENLMMAAVLADGITTIKNAAKEPEVVDLANCLNEMGAKISGIGTDEITIEGVERLNGADYRVMGDRIEAGTYMVATAMVGGNVECHGIDPTVLTPVIDKLEEAGATITSGDNWIRVESDGDLKAVNIETQPHPGFPTDMQAQFTVLNSVANGDSSVHETIFENRFMHVPELQRMGANLTVRGNTVYIKGVDRIKGAMVRATDLRASAALVLAGMVAEGVTEVEHIYHMDRGYENLEEKFNKIGARIIRQELNVHTA